MTAKKKDVDAVKVFLLHLTIPCGGIFFTAATKKEIVEMAEEHAVIETGFGRISLKFYPETAPNHVNNFIELA
ncbi:MAG: hypothetical protein HQK98_06560, partial [Nitrospirae bacterium]|nr:hypothetical protein [Nitrospirota bacterium]